MATILIVEDEVIEAMALREVLQAWGHRVLPIVTKGGEAVATVDREDPDLVLMDFFLADGTTGLDVVRRFPPGIASRVVFVTATDGELRSQAAELGCHVFLQKPYTDRQLRDAIREATRPAVE